MIHFIPGVYQVPRNHTVILEEFGKFTKLLTEGLNFANPFLYSAKSLSNWEGTASKYGYLMELTEQQMETPFHQCQTKDNVTIAATASIYFKIIDPEKAAYEVDELPKTIRTICLNALRSQIGHYQFDEIFSKRAEINTSITSELQEKVNRWGIKLLNIEVGKLEYDQEIYKALQKKRVAQAEKESKIIASEATALSEVKQMETQLKKAEIEAQIRKIETSSKANTYEIEKSSEILYLESLVKKIGPTAASQVFAASKASEAMKELSQTEHKLIVIPNDLSNMANLLGLKNLELGKKGFFS